MKELPIIFSGPMVRAILDGRKTQTRRIVKPPRRWPEFSHCDPFAMPPAVWWWNGKHDRVGVRKECPHGQPGDRLWVRETWQDVHPLQVAEGRYSQEGRAGIPGPPMVKYRTIYRADGEYPRIHFNHPDGSHVDDWPYRSVCTGEDCTRRHLHPAESYTGWMPSIHMPRWASRITLEVTGVRVERLQDITEDDARAEGIEQTARLVTDRDGTYWVCDSDSDLVGGFGCLWDSLNAKRAPWESNPWVWVIEFRLRERVG